MMNRIKNRYFLEELAEFILSEYGNDLSHLKIIFPNQRSAVLFTRYLSNTANKNIWSPALYSISGFIQSQSSLLIPDRLTLLSELHKSWNEVSGQEESFGKFYFWGELILKDFNEIDRWLGNADDIFRNLRDQKEIDEFFGDLNENELSALQSFWGSVHSHSEKSKNSAEKESFIRFWKSLGNLYNIYRKRLLDQNIAYEGLIYRIVAEKNILIQDNKDEYIFAGFNLLSTSEELIIKNYIEKYRARTYWDVDSWYMNNPEQEAGRFLREYAKDNLFTHHFPKRIPAAIQAEKSIIQYPLPSKSEQCMAAGKLIEKLLIEEGIPEEEIAVILPAEDLLFPLLNALPQAVKKINITMGYPLKHTPWFSLVEYLIQLQGNYTQSSEEIEFWYSPVLGLLRHPLLSDEISITTATQLQISNRIRVETEDLNPLFNSENGTLWKLIFTTCTEVEFPQHLLTIIKFLANNFNPDQDYYDINQDFSYQLYTQVNRINDLILSDSVEPGEQGWLPLFRQILSQVKLPFSGEPLEGLQIMGILESRNLDYKKVIILSMEEGSFPPAAENNSFIPFNLRKAFNLPLPDLQDASYAYYFYRLLHHAEETFLFYSPSSEGLKSGERSRYILQVENELLTKSPVIIQGKSETDAKIQIPPIINYSQHPQLLQSLRAIITKGISPSAINTLIDCKLRFAYQYLLGLKEPAEISEEIDPALFGSILHKAMDLLYNNLPEKSKGNITVNPQLLDQLNDKIESTLLEAFKSEVFEGKTPRWEGRNLIIKSVLEKYIKGILSIDKQNGPFTILQTEMRVEANLNVSMPILSSEKTEVRIKGFIDRVDETQDGIHIIDYKTGRDVRDFSTISDLINPNSGKTNKAALQTLIYGWMWLNSNPGYRSNSIPVATGLYLMRELYQPDFDFRLMHRPDGGKKIALKDIKPLIPELEEQLTNSLENLGNPDFIFTPTDDLKKCTYCPYAGICGRK